MGRNYNPPLNFLLGGNLQNAAAVAGATDPEAISDSSSFDGSSNEGEFDAIASISDGSSAPFYQNYDESEDEEPVADEVLEVVGEDHALDAVANPRNSPVPQKSVDQLDKNHCKIM